MSMKGSTYSGDSTLGLVRGSEWFFNITGRQGQVDTMVHKIELTRCFLHIAKMGSEEGRLGGALKASKLWFHQPFHIQSRLRLQLPSKSAALWIVSRFWPTQQDLPVQRRFTTGHCPKTLQLCLLVPSCECIHNSGECS